MKSAKGSPRFAALAKSLSAALLASVMDAVVTVDERQRVVFFNTSAERMFQCSQRDALGRKLDRFIPERLRAAHRRHVRRFGNAGETLRAMGHLGTLMGVRADGEEFPIEASISQIKVRSQKYFTAVVRDVTASRRAGEDLRRREEHFRSLIEYASDLITVIDEQGVIQFQSPSIERVLDFKPEEIVGHGISEFIHRDDLPLMAAIIRRALANPHSPVAIDHRLRHRDGVWRLFASIGRSLPTEAGGKRIVFNSRDVTAGRSLEQQLLQAQKMEAIGTLAGGIAHDFNNMLAGILGSAELVREDLPPDHPSQEYVQSIMTAASRARELVQQILTVSRRQRSQKRVLPLQPVVQECVKLLRSAIPAMVEITQHVEPECPPVLADPSQIHQVLMNICTNAWHALPDTGGRIAIHLQAVEAGATAAARPGDLRPGHYARLSVTDNGHGMDAVTREKIFEPFFTTKPAGKGSGLGLSVVKGIIKSHGGVLGVESEPGRGSAFHVYLPARPAPRTECSVPSAHIPRGNGQRILLVDDEQIVARSTEEFLRRLGYGVTRCGQAEEALAEFRRTPREFDLIITDWAMPGMSGTELVSAMRRVRSAIPMLLVSGFVDSLTEGVAAMAGLGEILIKPVHPEQLAQAVARAVGARQEG